MMIILVVGVLLCWSSMGAADGNCSACTTSDAVTCLGTEGFDTICNYTCGEGLTPVFSLTADNIDFYPHVGDDVSFAVNLTADNTTVDINVTASVTSGSEEAVATNEKGEYVYVVKNIRKEQEGETIVFHAVGTINGESVCSTLTLKIKYVFTVSLRLNETKYVTTQCSAGIDCEPLTIPITVSATVHDWSQILVYDTGPLGGPFPLQQPEDATGVEVIYSYHLAQPSKLKGEGGYTFYAEEIASGKTYRTPIVAASAYVHSTILTPLHTSYYVEEDDTVDMIVTLNTELRDSWDNVKVQVQLPSGELKDMSLDGVDINAVPVNLTFSVVNITLTEDSGVYQFIATEMTTDFGNTTYTANVTLFSLSVSSDSATIQEDKYIVTEGTETKLTCSVIGTDVNTAWFAAESTEPVSDNDTLAVYQVKEAAGRSLTFSDKAEYSDSGLFACNTSFDGAMRSKSVNVVVQGLKAIEYTKSGNLFQCRGSGNPKPTISWKINDQMLSVDTFDITMTEVDAYTVESNVTLEGDTICLGKDEITCSASNEMGAEEKDTIRVNEHDTYIYQNAYIVFVPVLKSYDDALTDCTGLGGSLLKIEDEKKQEKVLSFAKESNLEVFYAGAKKDEHGNWKWSDGTDASSLELPADAQDCATFEYDSRTLSWSVASSDCAALLDYSCQIIATTYPQDLELKSPPCDGDKINASWKVTGGEPASVTVDLVTLDGSASPETIELDSTDKEKMFEDVKANTEYEVKVSTKAKGYCTLNPYIEEEVTTGDEDSVPPDTVSMTYVNPTLCKVEWEYEEGNRDKVEHFYVDLTEQIRVDTTDAGDSETKSHELPYDATKFEFPTRPNSVYTAKVYALSDCGKNSTGVESVGICKTDIAAPETVELPEWHLQQSSSGPTIVIPPVGDRNGAVSCQFVVVRYVRPDEAHTSPDIDEAKFENIKDASVDDINIGDDYFAYATNRLSSSHTLVLGDGSESDCVPLPASGARRRRELTSGGDIKARNRGIQYGMQMQYYMITTTASEDGKTVYFANSEYSSTHIVNQREPKGPNAAAIVLSILAVLFVLILGVFCYRRWRSRRKSLSESSNRTFRFSNDVHYDVL